MNLSAITPVACAPSSRFTGIYYFKKPNDTDIWEKVTEASTLLGKNTPSLDGIGYYQDQFFNFDPYQFGANKCRLDTPYNKENDPILKAYQQAGFKLIKGGTDKPVVFREFKKEDIPIFIPSLKAYYSLPGVPRRYSADYVFNTQHTGPFIASAPEAPANSKYSKPYFITHDGTIFDNTFFKMVKRSIDTQWQALLDKAKTTPQA